MLARLSIRDIILIDRLDIEFASGLSVLTGETGAGKSILLDAFALALGARGDVALVRHGAEQGQVTAAFELSPGHPVRALMAENDIPAEDELILRRVQFADGRTRAFVNDQPLSARTGCPGDSSKAAVTWPCSAPWPTASARGIARQPPPHGHRAGRRQPSPPAS